MIPHEELSAEALTAMAERIERNGVLYYAEGSLLVSNDTPLVGEALVVAFNVTEHAGLNSAELKLNGRTVAPTAQHGEYILHPSSEEVLNFRFDGYAENGTVLFSNLIEIRPCFVRPRTSLHLTNSSKDNRVSPPELPIFHYSVENAESATLQLGNRRLNLRVGDGEVTIDSLPIGKHEARLIGKSCHSEISAEGVSETVCKFEYADPKPIFEEVSLEPSQPVAGRPALLTLQCRYADEVVMIDHTGASQRFSSEIRGGRIHTINLEPNEIGPFRLKLIAQGSGGSSSNELRGQVKAPPVNINVEIPTHLSENQTCTVRWESSGCRTLFLQHNIVWLEGIDPTSPLSRRGQITFRTMEYGDYWLEFIAEWTCRVFVPLPVLV